MKTAVAMLICGLLCSCARAPQPPLVAACVKLTGATPATVGPEMLKRCVCVEQKAQRQLDPPSYALVDRLSRDFLADSTPVVRGSSALWSIFDFGRRRGSVESAVTLTDLGVLTAKVARQCYMGADERDVLAIRRG